MPTTTRKKLKTAAIVLTTLAVISTILLPPNARLSIVAKQILRDITGTNKCSDTDEQDVVGTT